MLPLKGHLSCVTPTTPLHPLCLHPGWPVPWWSAGARDQELHRLIGTAPLPTAQPAAWHDLIANTASPCSPPHPGRHRTLTYDVSLSRRAPGIRIFCTEERSQGKNKERAFALLRSRLFELEQEKQRSAEAAKRKSQARRGAPALLGREG